jgi:mono/diheme cytochrome c family protein
MARTTAVFALPLVALGLAACGENSTPAASIGSAERVVSLAEGRSLYQAHCMMCHQPQGEGVPNMQPPLAGNAAVEGDVGYLVKVTVLGMGDDRGALEPSGDYRQQMQGFPDLSDDEIAAILTYIRKSWGNEAPSVTEEQVWDARQGL